MAGSADGHQSGGRRNVPVVAALIAVATTGTLIDLLDTGPSGAQEQQFLQFRNQLRSRPTGQSITKRTGGTAQMLVQADEIRYDTNNEVVSAVGNVQIYYNGATIEADRVIYDQRTKRLRAEGNARLTEADGKVSYGETMDLSDDYRDGFIDSLRLETANETRMAATRADRTGANYTVFQSGVYTACEPCRDDPRKPPLWQVKAVRIIHNEQEKMVYFENAAVEFFGVPLMWFPYLAEPDPSVKQKTGVLVPNYSSSTAYGFGIDIPYYFALAPNYDLTLTPRVTTTQGLLMQSEFRMRFDEGRLTVRAAGIDQLDKGLFGVGAPDYLNFRGAFEASGHFNLSPQWNWGFDAVAATDPLFFYDYRIRPLQAGLGDSLLAQVTEGVSQLFLSGRGDTSYFDIRAIHYYGYSPSDVQQQLPNVLPLIDYQYTFEQPVVGGELSTKFNFTGINRQQADFQPITLNAQNTNACAANSADPYARTAANCMLSGVAGDYARLSAQADWRSQYIDPLGQVWIPFASLRADGAAMQIPNDPGTSNFISPGDSEVVRAMPAVGLEYHYPFIGVTSWGTQTIEPIAQLIVRPNETNIGKLPNEDSQSLIFDDTNLFKVDKFAGWDRIEGGTRANAGIQYTAQFNQGGFVNMLFGQSYQLFGLNSFAVETPTNTGLGTGLDKPISDYVARVAYQPNQYYSFIARFRFDEETFATERMEFEARATFDRWNASVLYGDYAAQPELGFLARREGILTQAAYKLTENWVVNGAVRYDLVADKISEARVGFGYVDDCFILSFNYITDFLYTGVVAANQTYMLSFSLRTLGGSGPVPQ